MNLKDWHPSPTRKVFLAGAPKSAGKSTFAMTAPGRKLLLQYDLGSPTIPPNVDPSEIWCRSYAPLIGGMKRGEIWTDRFIPPVNVGNSILEDIDCVIQGFLASSPISFLDKEEVPLPDVLILDGMTELALVMTDWVLGVNKKTDADDFIGAKGQSNHYKLWQLRLKVIRNILHQVVPLPCSVVLIGWETPEMEMVDQQPRKTGKIIPDIGGKLDNMVPGKVDAALRCFSRHGNTTSYMVQTQADGVREWVGVRGAYNLQKEIDVTIHAGKHELSPWERVFGPSPHPSSRPSL